MKGNGDASTSLIIAALSENGVPGEMAGVEKAWMVVEKAHGPLQPTYVPEAGKEEEGWRPRPRFLRG
ncbi:hypothetical protein GQ600_20369 [Phytophthora cactorum]|nr:hypothetical protein GQ600_20369 [Phytophthora cactorum]